VCRILLPTQLSSTPPTRTLAVTAHGPQRPSLFRHLTILLCRITSQVMRHWPQHKAIEDKMPSARCGHLQALHRVQVADAILRTKEGKPDHSILQTDVPGREELDCEPSKRRKCIIT
jgi:hypothetical protein